MTVQDYFEDYFLQNVYEIIKLNLQDESFSFIKRFEDEPSAHKDYNSDTITAWFKGFADNGLIYSEDLVNYTMHTDISMLRRFFTFSDALLRLRYRRLIGSEYRWVMMEIRPAMEYTPETPYVIMTIMDVDDDILELLQSTQRDEMISQLNSQLDTLKAISGIYNSMHVINLASDSIYEFNADTKFKLYSSRSFHVKNILADMVNKTITPDYMPLAMEFFDLSTVAERMEGNTSISAEFIANKVGWIRVQFIANSYDEDRTLQSLVLTVQVIDAEKKREEHLMRISNTDEMTHLLNRRAYNSIISEYKNSDIDDVVVVLIDLNGLKHVNDNIGHKAGDELIISVSKYLTDILGHYGHIYRIGGDEFAAILHAEPVLIGELEKEFKDTISKWRGEYSSLLSVAWGAAAHLEYPDMTINDLLHIADQHMYADKELFYKTNSTFARR